MQSTLLRPRWLIDRDADAVAAIECGFTRGFPEDDYFAAWKDKKLTAKGVDLNGRLIAYCLRRPQRTQVAVVRLAAEPGHEWALEPLIADARLEMVATRKARVRVMARDDELATHLMLKDAGFTADVVEDGSWYRFRLAAEPECVGAWDAEDCQ